MGLIIAIEGLVHAGKSTLVGKLGEISGVKCVGEYVDFATSKFPGFPSDINEALKANTYFLKLEEKRKRSFRKDNAVIVLDRSFLSVLAYHFAVEQVTNGGIPCFSKSMYAFTDEKWILPNLCIYLDINDAEIRKRHLSEKGKYDSVLLDPIFNAHLRGFYEEFVSAHMPSIRIVKINAGYSPDKVLAEARRLLGK